MVEKMVQRAGQQAGQQEHWPARRRARNMIALFGVVVLHSAVADTLAAQQRVTPPRANAAPTAASDAALLREEDEVWSQRLRALRATYLRGASWAEMGDRCNPGAFRIFPNDTSIAQRDSLQKLVQRIEQTVIGRGAGNAVDTPDGRALLRTIVGWEAGIDRPKWDTDDAAARYAIATGLTGEYPDPRGSGCLTAIENDTVTFVVPAFRDMIFPNSPKVRVKAYFGAEGVNNARNEFVRARGTDATVDLSYNYVSPFVMWRDWAVVTVTRPLEAGGVDIAKRNNGGATYLMRKVGTEWRLTAILRSWGS